MPPRKTVKHKPSSPATTIELPLFIKAGSGSRANMFARLLGPDFQTAKLGECVRVVTESSNEDDEDDEYNELTLFIVYNQATAPRSLHEAIRTAFRRGFVISSVNGLPWLPDEEDEDDEDID